VSFGIRYSSQVYPPPLLCSPETLKSFDERVIDELTALGARGLEIREGYVEFRGPTFTELATEARVWGRKRNQLDVVGRGRLRLIDLGSSAVVEYQLDFTFLVAFTLVAALGMALLALRVSPITPVGAAALGLVAFIFLAGANGITSLLKFRGAVIRAVEMTITNSEPQKNLGPIL
jgi:hypothetical protein